MTVVALTTATATLPGSRCRSRTASALISETTVNGPHCISTCAITVSVTTLVTKPANPPKAAAPPPAMRAAPSIATPAKRPVEIVDHPRGVKRTVHTTPLALIDRFGVGPDADPGAVTPGGFREEFQRLRAGGAEA